MTTRYETTCRMENRHTGKVTYANYNLSDAAELKEWVRNAVSVGLEFSVRHYSDMYGISPFRVIARGYRKLSGEYIVDADWKV